jgi:uridine kinase
LKNKLIPFNRPQYDRHRKIRITETVQIEPTNVIIVEGALIFCNEELRRLFDLSVYIDTDDDVRLSRRVLKNEMITGPGKIPLEELLQTYEEKTKPAFERYIEPTKKYATTIIPNYGFSTTQLELDKMTIQGVDVIITHIE